MFVTCGGKLNAFVCWCRAGVERCLILGHKTSSEFQVSSILTSVLYEGRRQEAAALLVLKHCWGGQFLQKSKKWVKLLALWRSFCCLPFCALHLFTRPLHSKPVWELLTYIKSFKNGYVTILKLKVYNIKFFFGKNTNLYFCILSVKSHFILRQENKDTQLSFLSEDLLGHLPL